ncbi:MAG: hypothetical protein DRP62_07940 [Planctomycetota bacterium]|nr:MAG: hypothetical protein DRP62_07940 [Planctomycetota bacterium]
MKAKSGFTLVEILIVVVILGILAAIVIPQFTDASTEAKEASLKTNLQAIRSQIQLYKIKEGSLPTTIQAMVDDEYLERIPDNPFITGTNANVVETPPTKGNGSAWDYNAGTGDFYADDSNDHAAW